MAAAFFAIAQQDRHPRESEEALLGKALGAADGAIRVNAAYAKAYVRSRG